MAMARLMAVAMLLFAASGLGGSAVHAKERDSIVLLTSERIANHALSGFAAHGYDVVAYFIDGQPKAGSAEHEYVWNGVAWRFSSRANLIAFQRDPQVYAPRFGGYDADAAVRGIPAEADPSLFLIADGRLYLFRTREGRDRFRDAAPALRQAEERWAEVENRLGTQ